MHRTIKAATLFALATFTVPGVARLPPEENPRLSVFVFNDAQVSAGILSRAELRAAIIFERAGLQLTWVNRAHESDAHPSSLSALGATNHLVLRIVPHGARSARAEFGVAFLGRDGTGRYGDVFWGNIEELHRNCQIDAAGILGSVMAHEIGHLLLGAHGHAISGIMRGRWEDNELRQIAMGTLVFLPAQKKRMRTRMAKSGALLLSRTELPGQ